MPDRVEQLGTYEMVWDCKFCGTQGLPARTHKFCPNCGAAQDPKTRRFPSDDEKVKVENYIHHGADVICPNCSTPNAVAAKFCQQCGTPLEAAQAVAPVASQTRAEGEKFAAQAVRNLDQEQLDADLKAAQPSAKGGLNIRTLAIIGVIAAIVIGGIFLLTRQRDAAVTLVGHTWQRTINVEQFAAVPVQTWCDQLPIGAYSVSRSREVRDTRSVPDGESCQVVRSDNGDGTFSERRECETVYREEPIYDDYCAFSINQWVQSRQLVSSGDNASQALTWPLTSLNTGTCLGCEREGDRDEQYVVVLQSGDRAFECPVPLNFWQSAPEGSQWNVRVNVVTGRPDCDSLERVE